MANTTLTQTGQQVQNDLNLTENIQDEFSSSSTYAVGALVIYGSKIYRCHTAVSTAGAWTGSTNWTEQKLSDLLSLKQDTLTASSVNDGTIAKVIGFDSSNNLVKGTVGGGGGGTQLYKHQIEIDYNTYVFVSNSNTPINSAADIVGFNIIPLGFNTNTQISIIGCWVEVDFDHNITYIWLSFIDYSGYNSTRYVDTETATDTVTAL